MQSRRDQVQAYFFVVGRLVSALTRGRPDERTTPNRRFATGTFIGVLIAAIVAAGFGVYGAIFNGGNTSWKAEGQVTVDKNTGAHYVYLGGTLRPALNYSSALLAGDPDKEPTTVSQNSLRDAPRGMTIGIPNAPDSVPEPADLLSGGPWTTCATTKGDSDEPITDLHVGSRGQPLRDQEGLLVATPDGTDYLVWQGKKMRVPSSIADKLPGNAGSTPFPVTERWIDAIPSGGPDLSTPEISGIGSTTTKTADGKPDKVGRIYEVTDPINKSHEYLVRRQNGLAQVNQTVANIMLREPKTAAAYSDDTPKLIPGSPLLLSEPRSGEELPTELQNLPTHIRHRNAGSDARPCASFDPGSGRTSIRTAQPAAITGGGQTTSQSTGGQIAEQISVPPTKGVLVREQAAPGGPPGNYYLVNDLGVKYSVPANALEKLGYEEAPTATVPSSLLNMLPAGPALAPDQALQAQPVNSTSRKSE